MLGLQAGKCQDKKATEERGGGFPAKQTSEDKAGALDGFTGTPPTGNRQRRAKEMMPVMMVVVIVMMLMI